MSSGGSSAVCKVVGSAAVGTCVASLCEAFSPVAEVGIRSRFSDNWQLEVQESGNSLTTPSGPIGVAYDRGF